MDIIKIAMIGVGGVVLALVLKQQKSEYALYISIATALVILFYSVSRLTIVMDTLEKIQNYTHIDSTMVKILLKMIGITYVAEFSTGICRDAGYGALGSQIEMFAKLSIMAVSVPVLLALIQTIEGILAT